MKIVILSKTFTLLSFASTKKKPSTLQTRSERKLSQRFFLILPDARRSPTNHNPLMGLHPSPSNHKDFPSWVFLSEQKTSLMRSRTIKQSRWKQKEDIIILALVIFDPFSAAKRFTFGELFCDPFSKNKRNFHRGNYCFIVSTEISCTPGLSFYAPFLAARKFNLVYNLFSQIL